MPMPFATIRCGAAKARHLIDLHGWALVAQAGEVYHLSATAEAWASFKECDHAEDQPEAEREGEDDQAEGDAPARAAGRGARARRPAGRGRRG